MSKLKKIVAVLLTVIMAMALAVPALAVDPPTGSVTITNAKKGETYKLYKIMNLTKADTGTTSEKGYHYTINSKYTDVLTSAFNVISITDTDAFDYLNSETRMNHNAKNLANAIGSSLDADVTITISSEGTINVTPNTFALEPSTLSNDSVTVSGLEYGYYLMIPDATSTDGSILFSLRTVDGSSNITIRNKTTYPTPTKELKGPEDSSFHSGASYASAGEKIQFRITGKAGDLRSAQYEEYYFKITDVMENMTYVDGSAKLTLGSTVFSFTQNDGVYKLVDANGEEIGADRCSITYDNNTKTLTAEVKNLLRHDPPVNIVFEYDAVLDNTATMGTNGNDNKVKFTYSNNPNSNTTEESKEDKVTVYSFGLKLNKYGEDKSTELTGTKWKLEEKNGDSWDLRKEINGESLSTFDFARIGSGTFRLTETGTPAGYAPISTPIQFTIVPTVDADGHLTGVKMNDVSTNNYIKDYTVSADLSSDNNNGYFTINVWNGSQSALPATGGAGLYIVAGVAIVALLGFGGTAMLKRKVNGGE